MSTDSATGERTYICTWIYGDPQGEESVYHQVSGTSSTTAFQAVYWKCVALFFATSRRHNPEASHLLYTNLDAVPTIEGFDVELLLRKLDVRVVRLPMTYRAPDGYYGAWRNQFYVFDAITHLASIAGDDDCCLLLDSDCVWVRSASPIAAAVGQEGVLTYDIELPPGWPQNGLTREEMGAIYAELLPENPSAHPPYIGGELFAATGREARRVATEIDPLWQELLHRHADGEPKFNEEAHALSFIYHKLGYRSGTANPFIKRIWTALLTRGNARSPDRQLAVWHVPTEKRYGLKRMFEDLKDPSSRFWTASLGSDFIRYAGRRLGVPRRSPQKAALDIRDALNEKLASGTVISSIAGAARQNAVHLARGIGDHLRRTFRSSRRES